MMQQHLASLSHSNKEHAHRRMHQLHRMTDRLHPNSDRTQLIKGEQAGPGRNAWDAWLLYRT